MDFVDIFLQDTTLEFVFEIIVRSCIMFTMVIIFLRMSGKRGIRQLSIFELAIILSLGSASGDPMFMEDIPIVHALLVMVVILLLYRTITWSMMKHKKVEIFLEGEPMCIVEDGMMIVQDFKKEKYSHDEFFAEMRQQSIEHLGQVRVALLETEGYVSLLVYEEDEVKWGLPLFPKAYKKTDNILSGIYYSCMHCGMTTNKITVADQECQRCQGTKWANSLKTRYSRS